MHTNQARYFPRPDCALPRVSFRPPKDVLIRIATLLLLFAILTTACMAQTVLSQFTGPNSDIQVYPGQGFTTPSGGPWNQITFCFFLTNGGHSAAGTAYLLALPYTGKPSDLSSSTPGLVATSASIVNGCYTFAAAVMLQPGTPYYLYTDTPLALGFNLQGAVAGDVLY